MKKICSLLLTVFILTVTYTINAQTVNDSEWDKIDALIAKKSYSTAYSAATKLYNNARMEGNSRQTITSAYYLERIASYYQEDWRDSALERYTDIAGSLQPADQAICRALMGKDSAALANEEYLKHTDIHPYARFCHTSNDSLLITPTLYDLLMQRLISNASPAEAYRLNRKLIDFHANDAEYLRIWLDLREIEFIDRIPNRSLTTADLALYLHKYNTSLCPLVADLYYTMASKLTQQSHFTEAVAYCDTANIRFAGSNGAAQCYMLKQNITMPQLNVEMGSVAMSQHYDIMRITYRNISRLYFAVIKQITPNCTDCAAVYSKPQRIKVWQMDVPTNNEYRQAMAQAYLPPLDPGKYTLIVSPSKSLKDKGFVVHNFEVSNLDIIRLDGQEAGIALRRSTGRPVSGLVIEVEQKYYKNGWKLNTTTATTDNNGRFTYHLPTISGRQPSVTYRTIYEGRQLEFYTNGNLHSPAKVAEQISIFTDRPLYHPGEEVQFVGMIYETDHISQGRVLPQRNVTAILRDINYSDIDTLHLITDEYGTFTGRFLLPSGGLNGQWHIALKSSNTSNMSMVKVEEYKQPKFAVQLNTIQADQAYAFGHEVQLEGLAVSYADAPIANAKVTYSVQRRNARLWYGETTVVAEGSTVTGDDGRFVIKYVPEPDSNVELSHKPAFMFTVRADVTDLSGETHQQSYTQIVGYRGGIVSLLDVPDMTTHLDSVAFTYTDLSRNPIEGKVSLRLSRMGSTVVPRHKHPMMIDSAYQPLSRHEFHQRFPLVAYDETEYDCQDIDREVFQATKASISGGHFALPPLTSGRYRLDLMAVDASGDTAKTSTEVAIINNDNNNINIKELLWVSANPTTAQVGDTLSVTVATRHSGLIVTVIASTGGKTIAFWQPTLSNEAKTFAFTVDSSMIGGIDINVCAGLDGETVLEHRFTTVEMPGKRLHVSFESFRDKLAPGETETWHLRITNPKTTAPNSNAYSMAMTLYDAALDVYGEIPWNLWPWGSNRTYRFCNLTNQHQHWQLNYMHTATWPESKEYPTALWTLNEAYGFMRGPRILYKTMGHSTRNAASYTATQAFGNEVEAEEAIYANNAANDMLETATVDMERSEETVSQPTEVRSNLGTLAFFAPQLRTDSNGRIEYTFTLPDLLTRWQMRGIAISKDLQTGSVTKTMVTQKQLMVQPNVPRFLRQGDSACFMARVTNVSSSDMAVEVSLSLTGIPTMNKRLTLTAHSSQGVTFGFVVPDSLHAIEYRIVATGNGYADGERGAIAVMSNRAIVTRSVSVYMNGPGNKTIELADLCGNTSGKSHHPLMLCVEYTPNPIWQAIKSMPYIADLESPSLIFTANSLLVNTRARQLAANHPEMLEVFAAWQTDSAAQQSSLMLNADIKQTPLASTPWLRAAESESQLVANLATYMDPSKLASDRAELIRRLIDNQRSDGSWSWLPDGSDPSDYTTRLIVTNIGLMGRDQAGHDLWQAALKGLAYIDRQEQQYYVKYIKPLAKKKQPQCSPTNIAYLYLRSLYEGTAFAGGAKEAHTDYYNNALQRYAESDNLYTQAVMALTFARHRDKKQAQDLLRMLREKSLLSDEAGMYWRQNTGGYNWYNRPIETQAMLIQAFAEIDPADTTSIGLMQQWLLKQKQTTHWGTDVATTSAIEALMVGNEHSSIAARATGTVSVSTDTTTAATAPQAGTGYQSRRWHADNMPATSGHIVYTQTANSIAWGTAYYQYEDEMGNIPASETGVHLTKEVLRLLPDGTTLPANKTTLQVGDKVRIVLNIKIDRTLEYVELIDSRASCLEPLSTASGWRRNSGLSYYLSIGNTDMKFYIDRVDKGRYTAHYDAYVTAPGLYTTGLTTWQCMYAPEFRATAPALTIDVKEQ
ncbi:MAG: hypothetical protein K5650_05750 [Bacteroidales bacterium]|nr:hypothetical protein [Bacteroidales bacterium]